jgi:hypothetical protein
MFDFFLNAFRNPWLMLAGILLISVPIIIHLINRIRFKRIRWAAMEFLLKSQKRNRRRLILEQLLLLALRCLLVGLVGLLVARFVTDIGRLTAQDTRHYVLIDDTLSMNDHWQEQGKPMNSFDVAKAFTRAIAKTAVEEDTPQHMRVVLLSDLEHPVFDDRLNATTIGNLEATLTTLPAQATILHIDPAVGFNAANDFFAQHSEDKKVLHFCSDLREKDWNTTGSDLPKSVDKLMGLHVNVFLMDCAHPFRNENQQVVPNHDNLAITDLQPDTRYASKDGQVIEFTLTIMNFSPGEKKDYPIKVYLDGTDTHEPPGDKLDTIPVGSSTHRFSLIFANEGFNQVTAVLGEEKTGLQADNVRHTIVEVRARIPVLVVDGGFPDVDSEKSDTRFVREALKAAKGYEVVSANVDALEKSDLYATYPSIFLLNVRKIEGKALANLEEYVRKGGRVAFFLGDKVEAAKYNETLYNAGNGIFPVPLAARPTDKVKKEEREDQMVNGQDKVFVRDPNHPVVHGLASVSSVLQYLLIDQYYPTLPRFQWADKNIEELATLPSRKELGDFGALAQELLAKLPVDNPANVNARPALLRHRTNIQKALLGKYLFELAAALDAMLTDRGDPEPDPKKRDPNRPNLVVDFWKLPDQQDLKSNFEQLRDSVKYGDPFIVSKRFGKGRVVACMTSASTRWNEWAGGSVASFTFPMLITDLQKYLTGGNEESNRKMGETIELVREASAFEPRIIHTHKDGFDDKAPGDKNGAPEKDAGPAKPVVTTVEPNKEGLLVFAFTQKKKSGMDKFDLQPRGEPVPPPEAKAFVFNVDTEAESDLRRTAKDKLERNTSGGSGAQDQPKVKLVIGNDKLFKPGATLEEIQSERKSDWSEEPWFYLLFIVILVIEQALAVHLSFHLKGGVASEQSLPAQVLKSQGIAN